MRNKEIMITKKQGGNFLKEEQREGVGRHIKDFESAGEYHIFGTKWYYHSRCTSLKVCYIKTIRERSSRNTNHGAHMRGKRYDLSVLVSR